MRTVWFLHELKQKEVYHKVGYSSMGSQRFDQYQPVHAAELEGADGLVAVSLIEPQRRINRLAFELHGRPV